MFSMRSMLFLYFSLWLAVGCAVEWSKFKSCSDIGFCRRHRHFTAPPESRYDLRSSSLSITSWHDSPALTGIATAPDRPDLLLVVIALPNGIFRILFDDVEKPLFHRHVVPDIIMPHVQPLPLLESMLVVSADFANFSLPDSLFYLKINYRPIRVELYSKSSDSARVVFNAENRLLMEGFNTRPSDIDQDMKATQIPSASGIVSETELAETSQTCKETSENTDSESPSVGSTADVLESESVSCDGCWSEQFQSHTDPKVRGPESVGLDVSFPFAEHIYGIPERTVQFSLGNTIDKNGTVLSEPNRLYNLDVFEFEIDKPLGLYGAIPVLHARKEKDSVGIFWLNSAETFVDVIESEPGKKTHWYSETGIIDVFLCVGPTTTGVLNQYLWLTGKPAMPQRFALGYHQCRWNYRDDDDVRSVDAGFDKHNIPYDVVWLDIEHTDGKRYFTWDKERFPDSTALLNHLAARGRKMVTIVDPHVKKDKKYSIYQYGVDHDMYVKKADGMLYDGWCWPGTSSYFDTSSKRVRDLFGVLFSKEHYPHFSRHLHIWNDMNEPSVFNGPEGTMPKDMVHEGETEHRHVHNVYGHHYMEATFEGLKKGHGGNNRPFVLSRSFFAGSQRFGTIWTGDNTASWEHLRSSVRMLLPLQICGMFFAGADVGGFFGNPSPELLTRWYQVGSFQPFFRAHAHLDSNRREPWLLGDPYTEVISASIQRRYELLPYWYTLFSGSSLGAEVGFESSSNGPPMRPMWWEFAEDKESGINENQWMVGNALLCAPVMREGVSSHEIYLPDNETWYDIYAPEQPGKEIETKGKIEMDATLERMFVFQRGGSIIPKQERRRRSTLAMSQDPYTLVVALNDNKEARGELYMDDGASYDFNSGCFIIRKFLMQNGELTASSIKSSECLFEGRDSKVERIVIFGYGAKPPTAVNENDRNINFMLHEQSGVLTLQRVNVPIGLGEWKIQFLL